MRRTALLVLILIFGQLAGMVYAGLVSRPTKTCGTTTYDAEVAAGCTTIKSTEVDADLNAIITGGVNNIETANINAAGLGTAAIANGAITSAKIGAGEVTSGNILDGTIVNADIAAGAAIVGTKLADAPSGVPTAKINDGAITIAKMGVNATRRVIFCAAVTAGASIGPGVETTIYTQAFTSSGGTVFQIGQAAATWVTIGAGSGTAHWRWKLDGVTISQSQFDMVHDGAEASVVPSPTTLLFPASGARTASLTLELTGGSAGVLGTNATFPGQICLFEAA